MLSEIDEGNLIWHKRYEHLNLRDLSKLSEKKMLQGLPSQVCDMCCTGNQARSSYKAKVPVKATRKLEAIHSDVCGPFEVKSFGGNSNFVSFIDEFTRKLWVYLIANVFELFIK